MLSYFMPLWDQFIHHSVFVTGYKKAQKRETFMSASPGQLWPAVQSGTRRPVAICKVNVLLKYITACTWTTLVPFLNLDCLFPTEQCSWTLTLGSMASCWTASALWRASHRSSSLRAFIHCCLRTVSPRSFVMTSQQSLILNTKQEKTLRFHLTTFQSSLLMTFLSNLTAALMCSLKILNQSLHWVYPVLHYSVTSTRTHCASPLRLTGLASWSSTTSWMLPPCCQCWLWTSQMGRRFWISARHRGVKP